MTVCFKPFKRIRRLPRRRSSERRWGVPIEQLERREFLSLVGLPGGDESPSCPAEETNVAVITVTPSDDLATILQSAADNTVVSLTSGIFQLSGKAPYNQGILIENKTALTISGQGDDTILSVAGNASFGFYIGSNVQNLTVENLFLKGSPPLVVNTHGIGNFSGTTNVHHVTFANLHLEDFAVGISVATSSSGIYDEVTIRDNTIVRTIGFDAGWGYGIHLENVTNAMISSNHIEEGTRHSIYIARAKEGGNVTVERNIILNHDRYFQQPRFYAAALVISRSSDVKVAHNLLIDPRTIGIGVEPDEILGQSTENITLLGNQVLGAYYSGIWVVTDESITVLGNVIETQPVNLTPYPQWHEPISFFDFPRGIPTGSSVQSPNPRWDNLDFFVEMDEFVYVLKDGVLDQITPYSWSFTTSPTNWAAVEEMVADPNASDGDGKLLIRQDGILYEINPMTWEYRRHGSPIVPTLPIGEVGQVTNVTHVPQVIALSQHYKHPVVFAQSPSTYGIDPAVIRVTDITSDRFTMYLAEPSDQNGLHFAKESVTYLVLETGSHELPEGVRLEVGTVDTNATVGNIVDNQWQEVRFATTFPSDVVVLSQIQTTQGQAYLQTRQNDVTRNGLQIALEQQEVIGNHHREETIGYLAIEAGASTWNNMYFEAYTTLPSVTGDWYEHPFERSYHFSPNLLASLTSYNGKDNAHVRHTNLNGMSVELKVGEDMTRDTETVHVAESVAYLAIEGSGTLTAIVPQREVGELGRVDNLTHAPQTIRLNRSFAHPVVFAQSASSNGNEPVVVRVTDVETDRFTMYLAEPSNLNGLHHAEEMVTYVVLEAGSHELANGTRLEVGKVNTTATVGGIVANQWESIRFNMAFLSNPVLLSQVQTAGGQVYLATRQTNITTTGFQIALQQEESISTQHPMETIGYLAMEASKGEWSGMAYEAKNTANTVTDVTTTYGFDSHFVAPPQLLSSLTSYYGSDNAHVRYANLNGTNVQWRIGEDTTRDTETVHVAESVAYLAIAGTGSLRTMVSQQEIGEWRQVNNLTHLPQTILLSRPYVHPVVFAQSASSNGDDPVAVRVTDVKTDRFTTYLAEPSNLNGLHNAEESITYMVLEAGRHELVDGNRLEVGTVQTGATVGLIVANQWETVHFGETFVTAPVVLSQTQTAAGEAFLTTRQTNVTSTGFQVAVQQEEMINMQHPIETIGYLAIEARTGVWSGMVYETKNTTPAVTDSFTTHYFDHGFPTAPGLLSSLTSYHGADNAHVRYTNLNPTSVQLKAGEDTTRDTETTHSAESVAYLAIGSNEPSSTLKLLSANATPPQVIGVTKNGNFNSHDTLETLTFHFNHNILVQADNLTLFNENLGVAPVDLTGLSLSINRSQATATWDFTNIHRIEPGFYTAVLAANSITNFPGTPLDGDGNGTGRDDYLHHFLIAQRGDINWDGKIDISDFHGVRTNLDPGGNTTLHDWNHGNFDRDEDVDFSDLLRTVLNFSPQGYGTSSSPTTLMNLLTHNKKHTLETTDVPATEASGHQWSSWRYHHAGLPSPGPTPPPLDNSVVDDDFGRHVALPSGRNRLVIRFMDSVFADLAIRF